MGLPVTRTLRKIILAGLGSAVLSNLFCLAAWPAPVDTGNDGKFSVGYTVIDLPYRTGKKGTKTLTVAVWYPTTSTPARYTYGRPVSGMVALDAPPYRAERPYPLLVFSHGFGGSGLSAVFLNEQLAARGWIVAAPDHQDKYSAVRIRIGRNEDLDRIGFMLEAEKIGKSDADDRDKYLYRIDELRFVLDRMIGSSQFGKLIDRDRIAVGGHSLGGFTALGLCGTLEERRDDRIKAVLLYSTGAGGYLFRESELARVKIPSLYFMGEREKDQKRGKNTMEELADKVYRNLAPPKYLLVLKGGNHFSFNNRFSDKPGSSFLGGSEEQFDVIRRYSIAFLEKYVSGQKDGGGILERQDPLVTRYTRELGEVKAQ
jgi:predicted dienelactone hydrolase